MRPLARRAFADGVLSIRSGCAQGSGATALFVASEQGHDAVVRTLLASGAAVNQATTVGRLSCSVYVVYIGVVELSERTRPTCMSRVS